MNKTVEERITEAVRMSIMHDGGFVYGPDSRVVVELCKLAHFEQWTKSEMWSPHQSVVFHLSDLLKDYIEEKTDNNDSDLSGTLVNVARSFIDYDHLAKEIVYVAVEVLIYNDDRYFDPEDYLGPYDFDKWEESIK